MVRHYAVAGVASAIAGVAIVYGGSRPFLVTIYCAVVAVIWIYVSSQALTVALKGSVVKSP